MRRPKSTNTPGDESHFPLSEPIVLPLENWLDLHTFRPDELGELIPEYLELCHRHRLWEVKLIHGKGTGVLRARVRSILKRHPLVVGFADTEPEAGGWGATKVYLKSES